MDNDCAIGRNGGLLCRLPEDMKNFRAVTLNSTVIMGRKTYESFPKRPLPDRENLVLSRNAMDLEGAKVFADIESLMKYVKTVKNKVFVIGGGEIYKQLAPYCDEALITRMRIWTAMCSLKISSTIPNGNLQKRVLSSRRAAKIFDC